MNRQRGLSSLLMVLLLLALGTLLLQGLHQQQRSLLAQTASETRALGDAADAHSALQWGKGLVWPLQETVSCQQNAAFGWRGGILLWQSGAIEQNRVRFSPHGWSDFCPLKEASLCQMP